MNTTTITERDKQDTTRAIAARMVDGEQHTILGIPFRWEGHIFVNLGDTQQGLGHRFTIEELGAFIYENRTKFINLRVRT